MNYLNHNNIIKKYERKIKKLTKDKEILKKIIDDILWQAIRYSHGRHTYAPGMVRDAVKDLKKMYPRFKLKKDIVIKPPEENFVNKGIILRSDYLDDLFEEE